jgi:hypothetical protein
MKLLSNTGQVDSPAVRVTDCPGPGRAASLARWVTGEEEPNAALAFGRAPA